MPSRPPFSARSALSGWVGPAGAALLAGFVALVGLGLAPPPGSLDDLFVVLADARGWLGELGWVEGASRPDAEGTTSALDLALKAALLALGPDEDPVRLVGVALLPLLALTASAAALAGAHLAGPGRRGAGALLAGLGVATGLGLAESVAFRLEGAPHALVWVLALWAAGAGRLGWAAALSLPLALARPKAQLITPFVVALSGRGGRARLGFALGLIAPSMVAAVRLALYGAPWPNTFYAKASDSRAAEVLDGARYLAGALTSPAGAAVVALAIGVAVATRAPRDSAAVGRPGGAPVARGLGGLAALAGALLVASGGDSYAGARLAMPLAPALWLGAASALRGTPRPGVLAGLAGLALALQIAGAAPAGPADDRAPVAPALRALAAGPAGVEVLDGEPAAIRAMAAALDGETIAHRHAQRIRWFAPGADVLDMTGLTDAEVARRPHAGENRFGRDALDLALQREVGAIHLAVGWSAPVPWTEVPVLDALTDPRIHPRFIGAWPVAPALAERIAAGYRPASHRHGLRGGRGGWFNLLVRADLAARFEREGFSLGPPPARPEPPR